MTLLRRCPGLDGEGCSALLAAGRDRCNYCRRDRARLDLEAATTPDKRNPMTDTAQQPSAEDVASARELLASLPETERTEIASELLPDDVPTEGLSPDEIVAALENGDLNDYLARRR